LREHVREEHAFVKSHSASTSSSSVDGFKTQKNAVHVRIKAAKHLTVDASQAPAMGSDRRAAAESAVIAVGS